MLSGRIRRAPYNRLAMLRLFAAGTILPLCFIQSLFGLDPRGRPISIACKHLGQGPRGMEFILPNCIWLA